VIAEPAAAASLPAPTAAAAVADATETFVASTAAAQKKAPLRIRKADAAAGVSPADDAPF
jgi:hypothetical protein